MRSTRSTSFLALLLGGLTFFSCEKETSLNTQSNTQPVAVELNGSARVGGNATVQVNSIQDSRCPANAVCIRYGNADVTFTLSQGSLSQSGKLCLGECGTKGLHDKDSTTLQLGPDTYKVLLTEVRPYPGTTNDTKQTALLKVTKQ